MEMCWGDVGLLLSMPRQGLGNSAIASVANEEQAERFKGVWAGMAITEPEVGSDSANIRTTAVKDGDEYVINGEKIYVTAGDRCDAVVVWATLDRVTGACCDQVVRGPEGHARPDRGAARAQARHPLLRHRGDPLRRLPGAGREPARLAGRRHQPGLRRRDGDVRQHPPAGGGDGGRLRARVARPDPRAARAGRCRDRLRRSDVHARARRPPASCSWSPTGRAPTCSPWSRPGWPTTGSRTRCRPRWRRRRPAASAPTSPCGCVELCGSVGYSEHDLLEKWARDSKILDIFEGTQQIQQLIIARRLLGLSSTELK